MRTVLTASRRAPCSMSTRAVSACPYLLAYISGVCLFQDVGFCMRQKEFRRTEKKRILFRGLSLVPELRFLQARLAGQGDGGDASEVACVRADTRKKETL